MYSKSRIFFLFSILCFCFFLFYSCGNKNQEEQKPLTIDTTQVPLQTFDDGTTDDLVKVDNHDMLSPVQERLTKLFAIAKSGKFKSGTDYLAYMGPDSTRILKDSFNSSNELEAEAASYTLEEIKKWLGSSGKYEFASFYTQDKKGFEWFVQDVVFDRDGKPLKVSFWMLNINDQLVIGEMK